MEDSNKDKFEQFFQENLKDYNSSPSDDLWSELEYRIPPPPKTSFYKKIGGWVVLAIGLLILFSFTQWWQHKNELNKINQTLQQHQQEITTISNDLNNNNNSKSIEEPTEIISTNSNPRNFKNNNKTKSTLPHSDLKIIKENFNNIVEERYTTSKHVTTLLQNDNLAKTPIEIKEKYPKERIPSIAKPVFINPIDIFLDKPVTSLDLKNPDLLLDFRRPKSKISFEIYRNFSQLFPPLKISDFGIQSTTLPSRSIDIGSLFGIKLKKRVLLQIGISYGIESTGVQFQKTFNYSSSEINVGNNATQTHYSHQFNSNYENQTFNFFLLNQKQNDGQDIVANEPFTMDIQVTRRHRYLSVPLSIKYLLGDHNKRLTGSIRAGVFQKITYFENQLAEVKVNNISVSRLTADRITVAQLGTPYKKDLSYIIGAGVEFKIDKQLAIVLEPNFKKSFFKFNNVSPYAIGVYAGLRWNIFN